MDGSQETREGLEAGWVRPLLLVLLAATAFYGWFGAASARPWDADSLVRSMHIQAALRHPKFLIDPWTRPLGMIPYLPVAFLPLSAEAGFAVNRAMSAAYSILACLLVALAARAAGARRPWVAALALAAQPVFCEMSAGVTPETMAVFLAALGLWCHARGRVRGEVLAWSLLPLARFENAVLFLPVAAYLVWRRRPRLLPLLVLPVAAWYLLEATQKGELLWLRTYGGNMAAWNPYALDRNMVWQSETLFDPLHYIYLAPAIFGLPLLYLALVRLVRRWDFPALLLLTIFALHALMKGRAGHAGYPRYILPAAPFLALFAAQGLEALEAGLARWRAAVLRGLAAGALALTCILLCRPLPAEEPETGIRNQAADWLRVRAAGDLVLTSQPWISLLLDRNWVDLPRLNPAAVAAAPPGTWVVWDPTSARADHGVELEALRRDRSLRLEADFAPREWEWGEPERGVLGLPREYYRIVIFRKAGG